MPNITLPVYDRHAIAFPSFGEPSDDAQYATLEAILTEPATYDAHFSAYSVPEFPYRLKKEALKNTPVPLHLLVFDVDDPVAHLQDIPARAEWYATEQIKISSLLMRHDAFIYHTKGGYRVVAGWLPEPFVVADAEDAELWRAYYLTHRNALERRFGIVTDKACSDWQRCYRIPRACRDGVVQDLPTYGNPGSIGTYTDEHLTDEDVVEPKAPQESHPREGMRTDPPLEERAMMALEHVAKLPGSVQGAGAENTLWAACNVALVGYDLDVETAAFAIRESHIPKSTLDRPEHFEERMWKKLHELDASGGDKPFGHLLEGKKLAKAFDQIAPSKKKSSLLSQAVSKEPCLLVKDKPGNRSEVEKKDSAERSLADILDAFSPDIKPMPTPFKTLNEISRGGLRPKAVLGLAGAPGAGKTSLAVQLGAHYLDSGVPVCMLAADESIEFLLGRLAQRKGISRDDIEDGKPHAKAAFLRAAEGWQLLALDCDWEGCTAEHAARRLHELYGPGVLIVDSVQKVRTDTSGEAENAKARVDDVIATLKQAATLFGHLVITTSEVNRANYRNKSDQDNIADIAAAKESGDIEYGVKMLLVLKESKEEDLVDIATPKNRLGRGKPRWRLKWDHVRATFTEVAAPTAEDQEQKAKKSFELVKAAVGSVVRTGKMASKNQIVIALRSAGQSFRRQEVLEAITALEFELKISKASGAYMVLNEDT